MTDGERDPELRAVDRLTFFSDAVAAIAITLLAIDLPVPEGSTVSQFWSSVQQNDGHYAAFAISFLAIAVAWNHHHDVYRYVTSMDARLRTLNTAWLVTIILNPFATRLLTSRGHETTAVHALRFGFYSLLQALGAASLIAILRHILAHGQAPGMPSRVASATTGGSFAMMIGFGVSIPVFFVTENAWVLWFAAPPVARQLYVFRKRERRAT